MEDKLFLTEKECFCFEALNEQIQRHKYKREIANLKKQLHIQNVALYQYKIQDLKRAQAAEVEHAQDAGTRITQFEKQRQNLKAQLEEKYQLSGDWGYNPDTLEILT